MRSPSMLDDYGFREAGENDIRSLERFRLKLQSHVQAANSDAWKLSDKGRKGLQQTYAQSLVGDETKILVATCGTSGKIVAMAVGKIQHHEQFDPPSSGQISEVWVEPSHRKRGLCRLLVEQLFHFFRHQGVSAITLVYMHGNSQAAATWSQLGFRQVFIGATTDVF